MNKVSIIMYHYVRNIVSSRYPALKGLERHQFVEQVKYLKANYNFISMEQLIRSMETGEALPAKAVLLTFDDGYIDHFHNVFPVLDQYGVEASFYPSVTAITEHKLLEVNKLHLLLCYDPNLDNLLGRLKKLLEKYRHEFNLDSFQAYYDVLAVANRFDTRDVIFFKRLLQKVLDVDVRNLILDDLLAECIDVDQRVLAQELYMTKEQLELMQRCGMHIGGHGSRHRWLSSLTTAEKEEEIASSLEFIESINGKYREDLSFCYPYGDYDLETLSLVRQYGYKAGITATVGIADLGTNMDLLELPRLDANDIPKNTAGETNQWYDLG